MKKLVTQSGLLIMALFIAFSATSCKKKKKIAEKKTKGEVLINEYCSSDNYFSDGKTFRSTGTGESMDRETAKKKARSNANAELAKTIKTVMQIVGDNYVNSSEFNNQEEVTETFNEMSRTIVDQELIGAVKICDKLTQKENGNYVSYVAIELSGIRVAESYKEALSNDERIKAEFNYERFKQTFNEEMEKLGN